MLNPILYWTCIESYVVSNTHWTLCYIEHNIDLYCYKVEDAKTKNPASEFPAANT